IGFIGTVALLILIGVLSGHNTKDAQQFASGGHASAWLVCGTLMGTLVGGQSTIGTAQMAYSFGLSAWWFTIGCALGCLTLTFGFADPLRRTGCATLSDIIGKQYGKQAATLGSLLSLIGVFISIISQVMAAAALLSALLEIPIWIASIASGMLIIICVFFGGIRGAGLGGLLKTALLYLSIIIVATIIFYSSHGLDSLYQQMHHTITLPALSAINGLPEATEIHHVYLNPFSRGVLKTLGGCFSMILGDITTQSYAQAIWSARNHHVARRGALVACLLTPLIGGACTLVGFHMRAHCITASEAAQLASAGCDIPAGLFLIENSTEVFPQFILNYCPPLIGGIMLGTLLLTVIGSGSGLTLGAATLIAHNVMPSPKNERKTKSIPPKEKIQIQTFIVLISMAAVATALLIGDVLINDLGFLALGLRATAILIPLCFALFLPKAISPHQAIVSMVSGTLFMIIAAVISLPADPLFWGLGAALTSIIITRR
ncbi:MAG: hypothetical protein KBT04_04595, partial [Bacteroidales bacterium]|nr:hypothetical protein [Candidatus Colimorpha onthohippi]